MNDKSASYFANAMKRTKSLLYNDKDKYKNDYSQYEDEYNKILTYLNAIKNEDHEEFFLLKESIKVELKSSFETPYPNPKPEIIDNQTQFKIGTQTFKSTNEIKRFIRTQSLKSIVGFLNTNGGELFIGLEEQSNKKNKVISITEEENYVDDDKYIRSITQQVNNRIGQKFSSDFIEISIKNIGDKRICIIKIKPYHLKSGEIPAYLDEKELYRRTGPRTDKVPEGAEQARFITERIIKD